MLYRYREETQTKTVAAEETKVRPRKRKADVAIVSSVKGFQTSMQMLFFIFQLHVDEVLFVIYKKKRKDCISFLASVLLTFIVAGFINLFCVFVNSTLNFSIYKTWTMMR